MRNKAMDVGKRIAELRKKKGLTQKDLAERFHLTDKAVSRWESGLGYPGVDMISQLAELFEVSTDYLLTGTESQQQKQNKDVVPVTEPESSSVTEKPFKKAIDGKIKKKIIIITCASIVGIAAILGGVFGIRTFNLNKENTTAYRQALDQMESGKYDEAIGSFGKILSFSDSLRKVTVCKGLKQIDSAIFLKDQSFVDGITAIVGTSESVETKYDGAGEPIKDGAKQITIVLTSNSSELLTPDSVDGYSFSNWRAISCFYLDGLTHLFLNATWSKAA
jgi:transcriptional regulator with XRE-family HTH domain